MYGLTLSVVVSPPTATVNADAIAAVICMGALPGGSDVYGGWKPQLLVSTQQ